MRLTVKSLNPHFTYTDKKLDHIEYVSKILTKYNIKFSISQNQTSQCYQLQSESRPEFHKYYTLFYGYEGLNEHNQKRKILPNIIITPINLLNWFIGDGSSVKQIGTVRHKGQISCKYKNDFILEQLNTLFDNVKCYAYKTSTGDTCHTYHFNHNAFVKMLDYIGECPVDGYKYKWIVECSTTIIRTSD